MKKIIAVLAVCIFLVCMPMTSATIFETINTIRKKTISVDQSTSPADAPSWAQGNFTGVWGVDILGETHIPLGWLAGYHSNVKLGRFVGAFADFEADNITGYIGGFFFGPFMIGQIDDITDGNESENTTIFVGLGSYNETNFYWRIMGFKGPTFFMYGEYAKFE